MSSRDIAVVGMACVFPGAKDLIRFWYNLVNGIDALDLPSTQGPDKARRGHIPRPKEAKDAASGLLRGTIEPALQDAGIAPGDRLLSRTQLILGQGECRGGTSQQSAGYELTTRLAKELGLGIPASHVDASAARSLRALAWGMRALQEKRCDVLVFAAIHLLDDDSGEVRPLDDCVGTPVEGVAAVILKRRADAERAGDRAYAFIKGVATTQDGELHEAYTDAAMTPDDIGLLETQGGPDNSRELDIIKAIFGSRNKRRAMRPLGAITPQIGQPGAALGLASLIKMALCLSNKLIPPSVGGEAPSAVLGQLPFYLNIEPRPWIHDTSLPPRCGAVSALDLAGNASHVILEEISNQSGISKVLPRPIKTELAWDSEMVVLSANTPAEIAAHTRRLIAFLQRDGLDVSLAEVAYTQCLQFDPRATCRLTIVCGKIEKLLLHLLLCHDRLQTLDPSFEDVEAIYFSANGNHQSGKIACVFPGQGFPGLLGPYADHLLELCLRFPEMREAFDLADRRDGHSEDPTPTNQVFFPPATFPEQERKRLRQRLASPRLADAARLQIPAQRDLSSFGMLIANWGSWNLLQKLGVPVDMMFGQSHGELSALCAAGALDFTKVIPAHWQVEVDPEKYISGGGRLALVSANEEYLGPWLKRFPGVNIAVHISPDFQILGGEASQLKDLIADVHKSSIWTQILPYPAIHTPQFTSLRPVMEPHLESLPVRPFRVPVYSGMICGVYPKDPDTVRRTMITNLDHPVLLWQTTRKMYQDGARIFIQVGGGATMHAQAKTNIGADDVVAVSLDVDYRPALSQLNHMCATLLTKGVSLDLTHLYEHRSIKSLNIDVTEAELSRFGGVSGESVESPHDTDTLLDKPRMPFIGNIQHCIENQEIVIERVLDLSEDLFLADHLFIAAEGIKPISARSPVLPITVSMELMAEAAACLAPGCGLLGFEDIKATRWIEFVDTDTLPLQSSAKLHCYDETTGTYRIAVGVYIEKQDTPAIQATVLFGQRYQLNLDLSFSELQNPRRYPLSANQIYEERRLFHGPMFQCISGDTVLADHAVVGELDVLTKDGMFCSTRRPELLTDPILLDGVGQLIGLWAIDKGVYVFPVAIERIELYCPTPAVGTRVPVHIEITQYGSKLLYANVEIQDGADHVWMRIQGWGDWVFHWSEKVFHFRRQPTRYCLSDDFALDGFSENAIAQSVAKNALRDMDLEVMARFYLHVDEMPTFWQLAKVPARQLQWLLGRIAAKDAVRQWLARETGAEMLHPAAFIIENDEKGQPVVKNISGHSVLPKLSIAHSEDRAVALVDRETVGIDIERIADRDTSFLETIATHQERELLADFPGSEHNGWITRLWCAKEAAGKLIGTGVDVAPQGFEATDIDTSGAITILHHRGDRSMLVYTKQVSGFIIGYTSEALSPSKVHQRGQRVW